MPRDRVERPTNCAAGRAQSAWAAFHQTEFQRVSPFTIQNTVERRKEWNNKQEERPKEWYNKQVKDRNNYTRCKLSLFSLTTLNSKWIDKFQIKSHAQLPLVTTWTNYYLIIIRLFIIIIFILYCCCWFIIFISCTSSSYWFADSPPSFLLCTC